MLPFFFFHLKMATNNDALVLCKGSLWRAGHWHMMSDTSFFSPIFMPASLLLFLLGLPPSTGNPTKAGANGFFFLQVKVPCKTDICSHCPLNSLCYFKTSQSLKIGVDFEVALSAQVLFNGSESPSLSSLSHFFPQDNLF